MIKLKKIKKIKKKQLWGSALAADQRRSSKQHGLVD